MTYRVNIFCNCALTIPDFNSLLLALLEICYEISGFVGFPFYCHLSRFFVEVVVILVLNDDVGAVCL